MTARPLAAGPCAVARFGDGEALGGSRVSRPRPPSERRSTLDAARHRDDDRLCRLRPDRGQPARRAPARHPHLAPAAARRPSPDPARRGRHRPDRRPGRQVRRARSPLASSSSRPTSRRSGPSSGGFLDLSPAAGEAQGLLLDNSDWLCAYGFIDFLRDVGKHFTVNQMIAKESVKSRHRAARAGHLLHRVQLHAAAGLRLPPPARLLRMPSPDRRKRPVGQHHDGPRAHPQGARGRGFRVHLAAPLALRRHQVRQDRVRSRLARRRQDVALRSCTSTSCASPTTRWADCCASSRFSPTRRSPRSTSRSRPGPNAGRPRRSWRGR